MALGVRWRVIRVNRANDCLEFRVVAEDRLRFGAHEIEEGIRRSPCHPGDIYTAGHPARKLLLVWKTWRDPNLCPGEVHKNVLAIETALRNQKVPVSVLTGRSIIDTIEIHHSQSIKRAILGLARRNNNYPIKSQGVGTAVTIAVNPSQLPQGGGLRFQDRARSIRIAIKHSFDLLSGNFGLCSRRSGTRRAWRI